jgi:hypothetical protein
MLRCGPSKETSVDRAAFCRPERRSAGQNRHCCDSHNAFPSLCSVIAETAQVAGKDSFLQLDFKAETPAE